jgi:hypothetical protein
MPRTLAACLFVLALTPLVLRAAPPVDKDGRPLIKKLGTVDVDKTENSPVVFQGKLYRFEWYRNAKYSHFIDYETGATSKPMAHKLWYTNAFVEGDTVYVTGTEPGRKVFAFASKDLEHWEPYIAVDSPKHRFYNTSICKAGDRFVMMLEIDEPPEEAGVRFTARFVNSPDLRKWTWTPPECNYAKDRYTAPHCLRYLDGYYYDFYLEDFNGTYEQYVVRSKDLIHWEKSPVNPVLRSSPDDRKIRNPKLSPALRQRIATAKNINNSDIDFCEWQGRLIIFYSWGDQVGTEHLAEAVYEGSQADFLRGWFPEKKK